MCRCTPEIRTPFCGKPGCEMPAQKPHVLDQELVNLFVNLILTSTDRDGTMRNLCECPHEARAALDTIERRIRTIRASIAFA